MVFLGTIVSDWLTAIKNMTASDIDLPNGIFETSNLTGGNGTNRWEELGYIACPLNNDKSKRYAEIAYFPSLTSFTTKSGILDGSGSINYGDNTIRDMKFWGQFIYTV